MDLHTFELCFYRPQRIWGKVIFSEACVKNSVHRGGMRGRGACVAGGHAWQEGHEWQVAYMAGGVHGRGHAWQGECMAGGMHGMCAPPSRYYEIL